MVALQDFGLPFGTQGHEARGEAADFDDKALVAFGVDLRVKEFFARKAVWLEKVDALGGEDPEDGL